MDPFASCSIPRPGPLPGTEHTHGTHSERINSLYQLLRKVDEKQKVKPLPQGVSNLIGKTSHTLRRVYDIKNMYECQLVVPAVDFVRIQGRNRSELGQSEEV